MFHLAEGGRSAKISVVGMIRFLGSKKKLFTDHLTVITDFHDFSLIMEMVYIRHPVAASGDSESMVLGYLKFIPCFTLMIGQ